MGGNAFSPGANNGKFLGKMMAEYMGQGKQYVYIWGWGGAGEAGFHMWERAYVGKSFSFFQPQSAPVYTS